MTIPVPTVNELIALINKSSKPFLLVEGSDDLHAIRTVEKEVGATGPLLICGGRTQLFELVDARLRIINSRVVFLADQDLFLIEGGHKIHPDLIYTWGYSLENDIVAGSKIDALIRAEEKEDFNALCDLAVKWFVFTIEFAKRNGHTPEIRTALPAIINAADICLLPHVPHSDKIYVVDSKLYKKIAKNFRKFLRGKQLLQLYLFILNRPKRDARFSKQALIDCCVTQSRNRHLQTIVAKIKRSFGI